MKKNGSAAKALNDRPNKNSASNDAANHFLKDLDECMPLFVPNFVKDANSERHFVLNKP